MLELWQSFLELIPNVVYTRKELLKCIIQTLQMVGWTTLYSAGFGVIFGVTLVVTQKEGILECKPVYQILDKLINVFRSIPFVILVALLIKLTRKISGTSIGTKGMIFPMIVATVPFLSRQIHSALVEIDPGMIEAAQSMGASIPEIIFKVIIPEAKTSLIVGATISSGTILGYSAMSGAIGGGGLGKIAISYGYNRYQTDVLLVTVVLLIVLMQIIQIIGMYISRKTDKRIRE